MASAWPNGKQNIINHGCNFHHYLRRHLRSHFLAVI